MSVQLSTIREMKISDTYREVIKWLNVSISNINERISGIITTLASEVRVMPGQVRDEFVRLSRQTEDTINKTIEKGTLFVKGVTESLVISFKEAKKKLTEK